MKEIIKTLKKANELCRAKTEGYAKKVLGFGLTTDILTIQVTSDYFDELSKDKEVKRLVRTYEEGTIYHDSFEEDGCIIMTVR
ncbi:MAG: hypothetical protein KBT03_09320 [Bacteroidales bacterium]|nr:hypothetical protein [Candidatus Scybalousia scybalohippi]